jgi:hypothetical protein
MSSVRQRPLIGCQLIAGWPLIVSNRLGENESISSLMAHYARGTHPLQPSTLNGLAYASNHLIPPSLPGATLTCDPQVRIAGQDAFK